MYERLIARAGLATAFCTLTLAMLVLARQPLTNRPAAEIGKSAPQFTLPTTTGTSLSLADFRGQSLVLFFGSDTCPLSQRYADRLLTLARTHTNDSDIQFLAINSNTHHTPGTSPTLVNSPQIPTLLDPTATVAQAYGATHTPTFCVIDSVGTLRYAGAFDNGHNSPPAKDQYLARAVERTVDGIPCNIPCTQAFGRAIALAK
jgi:peroxiredoxin